MSGFAAIFDRAPANQARDPGDLSGIATAMSAVLSHRGEVSRCVALSGGRAAVATRDYAEGVFRTLVEDDEERVVIFDGFLFNEAEICARFETAALGEAIWRAFRANGTESLAALDGPFALVIHDRRRGSFHLARDRFGHRPLLLSMIGDQVVCASEGKAFFAHPDFERRLNHDVLPAVLSYGLELGPESLLEGLVKCLPGQVCEISERGSVSHSLYYRPDLRIDEARSLADLKAAVDAQLTETVAGYGRRCGRLGIFLSGGIDSALLAGKLADLGGQPGPAVSFGVKDWSADETTAAAEVARQLDLPFIPARADTDFDALPHLRDAIRHVEAPTRFENAIALEVASKAGHGQMDAVLTGQGGGSLFGQRQHTTIRQGARLAKLPDPLRDLLGSLCGLLPGRFMQSVAFFLRHRTFESYARKLYLWSPELVLSKDTLPPAGNGLHHVEEIFSVHEPVAAYTLVNILGFWQCWIERIEKIAAAQGLDAVHPIHRNKTLELAVTSPLHTKVPPGGRAQKPSLQQLVAERLGEEAANRPKRPLAAPVALWLDRPSPLRSAALALRSKDSLFRAHLDPTGPDRVLQDFAERGAGHPATRKAVFLLLSFEIWLQEFLAAPAKP